jgi:AAA+ superfamily predicted ATPase/intein/homing endonuclease
VASSKGKPVNTPPPEAKEIYDQAGKLFEENKFDESIALYTQAIEKYPDYSSAYFNRALSYALQSQYEKATNDAMKVMELEPEAPDAPYVMGVISEYQHDYDGAIEWYEKSLKNNKDYTQAKDRMKMLKDKMKSGGAGGPVKLGEGSAGGTKTVIEEGQIKQVRWFTSDMTFKDVVGMKKQKEMIHDNIILALTKPELLRAYGKKLGLGAVLYGPPGNGKCLSKDAEVLLPDGRIMRIEEVVERKEPYVLTLTPMHKLAVKKVSGWWKLKGKPLLRITTKRGRVVECTPEHPFLMKEGWKEAGTLKEGDRIGVPRLLAVFGNTVMRECEVKLLAYFIAEGGLTQGMPVFSNKDPELLEDFKSAVAQFDQGLHMNTVISYGNVMNLQIAGRHLNTSGPQVRSSMQSFLDAHILSFTNSYNKKIPADVFTLQKHLLALFLNRLFSGDGWFEDNEVAGERYGTKRQRVVGYASNSEVLVKQVQHLLLRFGILSSIFKHSTGFQLLVQRNRDVDTFIDEIGMFGSRAALLSKKKELWSKIKKKGGNRVVYEQIKKIENLSAPEHVYDLTVDETHNFVANDFFVHNTYVVRAIAGETKAKFIVMNINEIVDMYAGNTEKNLHAVFEQARKNAPCIVFVDEVDALGTKREGEQQSNMRMAVNQFLQELDGIEKNPEGIFVIGATNQPWDMDPALKRPGRFGESIYVPAPDYKTRKAAFKYNTRKMPLGGWISFDRLARASTGFSQADIASICDKAALKVAAEVDRTGKKRKIGMKDFIAIIKAQGSSLDEWYGMVKKEVISKTETQIVKGEKTEIVKEGKLSTEEKQRYKPMVKDIKWNLNPGVKLVKKIIRTWATYLF